MSEPHYFNMENDELKRTFAAQLHQLVSAALPYDETPRPEYYVDTKAVADDCAMSWSDWTLRSTS
jgi:hypothetical protein